MFFLKLDPSGRLVSHPSDGETRMFVAPTDPKIDRQVLIAHWKSSVGDLGEEMYLLVQIVACGAGVDFEVLELDAIKMLDSISACFPTTATRREMAVDSDEDDEDSVSPSSPKRQAGRVRGRDGDFSTVSASPSKRSRETDSTEPINGWTGVSDAWLYPDAKSLEDGVVAESWSISETSPPCLSSETCAELEPLYRISNDQSSDVPRTSFLLLKLRPSISNVAFVCAHTTPALGALSVPTRSRIPEEEAVEEDGAKGDAESRATRAAAAGGGGEHFLPWKLELYSCGTQRREDWHGGGKRPEEMVADMRRRFASGSFRVVVDPSQSWNGDVRDTTTESLENATTSKPSLNLPPFLRYKKVTAGPNRDVFLLVARKKQ